MARRRRLSVTPLVVVLALAPAATRAGRVRQAAPQPPKAIVPVAASTLAAQPDDYYGQHVTVYAAVEERLSDSAFTIDQDARTHTGLELLVLTPPLTGPLELDTYVTVIGEVVRFLPYEMGGLSLNFPLALPAHVSAKYAHRPAVLATSVITSAMVDLAKKPLPPLTPEETAYDQTMKRVGIAYARIRDANEGADTAGSFQAATLKDAFVETEAFWKSRGKADASTWAREARTLAESIERAMSGGRWDEAKQSTSQLGQRCQACHSVYRERLEDGAYRIKRDQ
jgi:cytochrome c556